MHLLAVLSALHGRKMLVIVETVPPTYPGPARKRRWWVNEVDKEW